MLYRKHTPSKGVLGQIDSSSNNIHEMIPVIKAVRSSVNLNPAYRARSPKHVKKR